MNILHVSTAKTWRGGEQQIAYLIEELDKLGLSQAVVCASGSELVKYCRNNSINCSSVKKSTAIDVKFARAIKKEAAACNADLIHIHDSHAHTDAVLSSILFGNKLPMVVSRRVDFPIEANWFSIIKYNYSSVKKIICVSYEIEKIVSPSIKDKKKLTTIHSGIDLSRFQEKGDILRKTYNIPEDQLLIGNVAAIAPHKDYHTFLKTVKILKEKIKAKYFIIGDGPNRKKIEKEVKTSGLEKEVIMTGFRSDLEKILPELDIFLMTSKTEGLGTSILDAFLAGVPVVTTEAGGIPEMVTNEKTGLLAPIQDHEKLAAQILKLVEDKQLAAWLIENARKLVKEFSKEKMAKRTYKVYREIVG